MQRDASDALIDFFANGVYHSNTLALAMLEPYKVKKLGPFESGFPTEKPQKHNKIVKNQQIEKAFEPVKLLIEELRHKGHDYDAETFTFQVQEFKAVIAKTFDDIIKKEELRNLEANRKPQPPGDEAFLRDHNLLPKLIAHPTMTLGNILLVYPNLPYPKYFNKDAPVKTLLAEWLPLLSKYSRHYLVEANENDSQGLLLTVMQILSDKSQSTKKKRRRAKDQAADLPSGDPKGRSPIESRKI